MTENRTNPKLFIVIPCFNEEEVLPITAPQFLQKLSALISGGMIAPDSRVLFVDDGSCDRTWEIITALANHDEHFLGMSLSRNRGHQNALLSGLMEAKSMCDVTISIDCDGQDDLDAMDEMMRAYRDGADVVYGVRSNRDTDTAFKRFTAEGFYKLMQKIGVEIVFNHADYRLASAKVLDAFADFKEVNLFLRGMFPLVGFRSATASYERRERIAGTSHYPLKKMLALAFDGITSLSVKPLRMLTVIGACIDALSLLGLLLAVIFAIAGKSSGWVWAVCIFSFLSGLQLCGMGILGEYIGKIYAETKARPRYIVAARTWED